MKFEWHGPKAAVNLLKHNVTFEEAMTVFGDPLGRITDDPRHSEGEERFVLLGQSNKRRLLVVMFTERGEPIHLISARTAARHERREYEEGEGSEGANADDRNRRDPARVRFQPLQAEQVRLSLCQGQHRGDA